MKFISKYVLPNWGVVLMALATEGAPLYGQDQPSDPPAIPSPAAKTTAPQNAASKNPSSTTSKDRLFFVLPNFLTLDKAGKVPPLTTGQKFKVTAQSSFDFVQFFWYGTLAGIGQAENNQSRYGQGAEGYAKRFGAHFADGTLENFTTSAILPSLLHQDPRYFQKGSGGFWNRTGYALSRLVVTRGDNGRNQFNYSEVFGSAASSGISTFTYYPRGDRNLSNALSLWGSQVGYDAALFVLKEFWPDLRRKLRGSKVAPNSSTTAVPQP